MALFFDFIGFILSLSSVVIVAYESHALVGFLRRGIQALLLGLFFIAMSFVWSIVVQWMGWYGLSDLRQVILSFGMIFFLISSARLFSIHK